MKIFIYIYTCIIIIILCYCLLQELKQQNELMTETKSLLEQKVSSLTVRSDMLDDLQVEVASLKAQLESLHQEKQMDLERIEDLVAQTARYELENKSK